MVGGSFLISIAPLARSLLLLYGHNLLEVLKPVPTARQETWKGRMGGLGAAPPILGLCFNWVVRVTGNEEKKVLD